MLAPGADLLGREECPRALCVGRAITDGWGNRGGRKSSRERARAPGVTFVSRAIERTPAGNRTRPPARPVRWMARAVAGTLGGAGHHWRRTRPALGVSTGIVMGARRPKAGEGVP